MTIRRVTMGAAGEIAVDSREIEVFLTLARELHFGRTAEVLTVSTAWVSQSIRRFERRIGAPLFERTSRRVALTALGAQLFDDLVPAYGAVTDALTRAAATAADTVGRLAVGFLGPTAGDFVAATTKALRVRHPDCVVTMREADLGDPLSGIRSGAVDLVFTKLPVRDTGLRTGPVLLRTPRLLAVSRRSPLARLRRVTPEVIAGLPFVDLTASVPAYWREALLPRQVGGTPIRRGPTVRTLPEALLVVADGDAVCSVDAGVVRNLGRPDITYLPLPCWPSFEFALVSSTARDTPLMRAFTAAATRTSRRIRQTK
ncbi:LysR family transcriptional regulator [Nocardia bovistercoris]|uniref:LysR family transcriptional regulator n=1 Tax=Nocardia bovistercoris TaxID=2785916 RepID=A0A931MZS1_9NOCA|nr:LysR family transcriptional regulator [Nocardia bovistercoris]MBH0776450.1 LysR family transcriptional regulator [Nocardia bovistercoris]